MVPSTYLGRESEARAEAPARRQCLGPAGPPRLIPRPMATPKHSPNPLSICQSANEKQAVEKPQDFVSIRPDKGLKKVHDSQLPRTTLVTGNWQAWWDAPIREGKGQFGAPLFLLRVA